MSVDSGNDSVSDEFVILLEGGRPWGFTLQGGADFRSPLKVGRVTRNGRAEKAGLISGDIILNINNIPTARMKHHEAQRLILATSTTLELNCTKVNSGIVLSPKSTTVNNSFEFPSITVPQNKTGSLGRHARQSSLDLDMFRPRSNSDAKKTTCMSIKKPAPPKFAKTSSADVASTGSPRVIAGITVPPRPPGVTPKKEPPVHPSGSESVPVVSGFAANGPCVTPPITSEAAIVMHSESVDDDDEKSSEEGVEVEEKTESTSVENSTEVTVTSVVETNTISLVETSAVDDAATTSAVDNAATTSAVDNAATTSAVDNAATTSASEECNEEVEFHQPEIRAYSIQLAEVHYLPKEQLKEELKTPPTNNTTETTTEQKPLTSNDDSSSTNTSSYKGFNTSVDMDSYGGILSTSGGSDWYRSMFQSMKKGVEEDLPEKKPVWERTVVPARESNINFTPSKNTGPPPAAKPASYISSSKRLSWTSTSHGSYVSSAQTKRRSSESSMPNPAQNTSTPRVVSRQAKSTSTIVRPADFVADADAAVVFSQNSRRSFSKSRNYWQSIEQQASQEKEEVEAKRNSLRRRSFSLTSSGGSPRSPDNVASLSSPTNVSPPTITSPSNVTPPPINSPPIINTANDISALNEEIAKLGNFSPEPITTSNQPHTTATAAGDSDAVDGNGDVFVDNDPSTVQATTNSGKSTPVMSDIVYSDSPGLGRRLHPLLSAELEDDASKPGPSDTATQPQQDVFSRIDASKLNSAIGNASMLGKMEQDGVNPLALQTMAITVGQQGTQPQQKEPAKKKTKPVKPPPGRKAQGKFDFESASDKEVSFKKGDIIDLTKEIDANWLEGTVNGVTGIFPISYVKVLTDQEIDELESANTVSTDILIAKAKFNFVAKSDRELSFNKDDIITLTRQIDDNWYEGHIQDMKGIVPSSYIQLLSEEQH